MQKKMQKPTSKSESKTVWRTRKEMHKYIDHLLDMGFAVLVGGQRGGYSYYYHGNKRSIASFASKIVKLYNEGKL